MWLVLLLVLGVVAIVPWWAIGTALRHGREIERLRNRVDDLERRLARDGALTPVPKPEEAPSFTPAEPIPLPTPAVTESHATTPDAASTAATRGPHASTAATTSTTGERSDGSRFEQLVGGVWLQNIGGVMLLLGTFFLILWGYTTGWIGPALLVAAGVALGLAFAWRGDRLARRLPAFGHAVIGIGLGIVYLSLYLGHFTLRVLPAGPAFVLLAAVSLATVAVGMRYRAQTIAFLGVAGAFVPQLIASWIPLRGFSLPPGPLLGYFAVVDLVVFALAARAGWSPLNLTALALTAVTWITSFPGPPAWGWGIEIGLCALFTLLGLAPVPRLASLEDRVRAGELAVVALAPLSLIAVSWPFLAATGRVPAAILLIGLAIAYLLAALWVDARRPERDLWRPLTGAATVFLTASLQRAVGDENTPMAWCVEGCVLVWLGLSDRGGWLRFSGYVVEALGALLVMAMMMTRVSWSPGMAPVFHPDGIRDLVSLAAMVTLAALIARRRRYLSLNEAPMPELWTALANALILGWSAREAGLAARMLQESGTSLAPAASVPASPRADPRSVGTIAAVLTSGAWTIQAITLLVLGWTKDSAYLRWLGLGILGLTVLKFLLIDLQHVEVFWRFLTAIVVGAALLGVSYLYQRRARRDPGP